MNVVTFFFSFDVQASVKIRTEDGPCLEISPETCYSEDFEPYESVDMEVGDDVY